jgi:hypothetical protein
MKDFLAAAMLTAEPLKRFHLALCAGLLSLQVLTFFSSLFGDLIESIMKRDAGIKVKLQITSTSSTCGNLCSACCQSFVQCSLLAGVVTAVAAAAELPSVPLYAASGRCCGPP